MLSLKEVVLNREVWDPRDTAAPWTHMLLDVTRLRRAIIIFLFSPLAKAPRDSFQFYPLDFFGGLTATHKISAQLSFLAKILVS